MDRAAQPRRAVPARSAGLTAVLRYRLITGPILAVVVLAIVLLDNWVDGLQLGGFWKDLFNGKENPPRGLVLFVALLALSPLAARELSQIFRASGISTRAWLTTLAAITGLVLSYSVPTRTTVSPGMVAPGTDAITTTAILSTGMLLVFVTALLTFSRHQNTAGVVAAAGAVMFAMVYLGFMMGFLLALRRSHSAWVVVAVIAVTKASDTGAYFTGRSVGRHKMIPWLSPGKTWEGMAGGIAASVVAGMALAAANGLLAGADRVPLWLGAECGVIFAIVGQLGDLTVSLFKRGAGLKDSSSILPGLGGVLDVLDSPLMVAPVAYWILRSSLSGGP